MAVSFRSMSVGMAMDVVSVNVGMRVRCFARRVKAKENSNGSAEHERDDDRA